MVNARIPPGHDIVRAEHRALAAVLQSMKMVLDRARRHGRTPDFAVLQAMLVYVDEFPERLHHPKESEVLFPRLRKRAPDLGPVLDTLEAQHDRGEQSIREVEHLLLLYQVFGEPRRQAFERRLDDYVNAYLNHMHVEESQVLPAALTALTPADWREIDAAFAANRDPLTGHEPSGEYQALFRTIAEHTPAPIGLGAADDV